MSGLWCVDSFQNGNRRPVAAAVPAEQVALWFADKLDPGAAY